jgi:hypothetical protein
MTRRAIDSQATAAAMIEHYIAKGAAKVAAEAEQERLRKEVEKGVKQWQLIG